MRGPAGLLPDGDVDVFQRLYAHGARKESQALGMLLRRGIDRQDAGHRRIGPRGGREVASHGKKMDMRVIGMRRNPGDVPHVDRVYTREELPAMLAEADVPWR